MGFDIPLVGFSERELAALNVSGNPGLTDPDAVPERARGTGLAPGRRLDARPAPAAVRRCYVQD